MAAIYMKQGMTIASRGDVIRQMYVIASGNVILRFPGGSILLGKGDILGAVDIFSKEYSGDYIAKTDCNLLPYPYGSPSQFLRLIHSKADIAHLLFSSLMRQTTLLIKTTNALLKKCGSMSDKIKDFYENYKYDCEKIGLPVKSIPNPDLLEPISLEEQIPDWSEGYYESLTTLDKGIKTGFYGNPKLLEGFLYHAADNAGFARSICNVASDFYRDSLNSLINEDKNDALNVYEQFVLKASLKVADPSYLYDKVETIYDALKNSGVVNPNLVQARKEAFMVQTLVKKDSTEELDDMDIDVLTDSPDIIFNYSNVDQETRARIKENLELYRCLADKNATDESTRLLRKDLTNDFYDLYIRTFMTSLSTPMMPDSVNMFLNFGMLDERLVSDENLKYLLKLSRNYHGAQEFGIYTILEWLRAIYGNRKEPSRNEFDLDYPAYLREQKAQGKISQAEEVDLLTDSRQKVLFEMENMFKSGNKLANGAITTFCPVLSEHSILRDLETSLVSPERLAMAFRKIKSIDFSAFFRETSYSSPQNGVPKEYIKVEIVPDVILMPCVGTRGSMWQEIEGKVRTSHSRMILPTFLMDSITKLLTRLTGEFRWEMCKRVQGVHWQDVTDPSLTSEYCDYIQFYRKNSELSPDAKEKIKNNLAKARNNFKEMFVKDYMDWISYEGEGSPRLNKIARAIFLTYCPFPTEIREKLNSHPLYADGIRKYTIKNTQQRNRFNALINKLEKDGYDVPDPIQMQIYMLEL